MYKNLFKILTDIVEKEQTIDILTDYIKEKHVASIINDYKKDLEYSEILNDKWKMVVNQIDYNTHEKNKNKKSPFFWLINRLRESNYYLPYDFNMSSDLKDIINCIETVPIEILDEIIMCHYDNKRYKEFKGWFS